MNNDDNLIDLLNNDSFIKWLDGDADFDDNKKWNNWLNENSEQKSRIVSRIQKIRSIPFQDSPQQNIQKELNKLEKILTETKLSFEERNK